jgi:hypothetical protein
MRGRFFEDAVKVVFVAAFRVVRKLVFKLDDVTTRSMRSPVTLLDAKALAIGFFSDQRFDESAKEGD